LGKPSWACLSHRSLEGGTRVQQIIIGYFVAPISPWISFAKKNNQEYLWLIQIFITTSKFNFLWLGSFQICDLLLHLQ
jgi:hypothetical protein